MGDGCAASSGQRPGSFQQQVRGRTSPADICAVLDFSGGTSKVLCMDFTNTKVLIIEFTFTKLKVLFFILHSSLVKA